MSNIMCGWIVYRLKIAEWNKIILKMFNSDIQRDFTFCFAEYLHIISVDNKRASRMYFLVQKTTLSL